MSMDNLQSPQEMSMSSKQLEESLIRMTMVKAEKKIKLKKKIDRVKRLCSKMLSSPALNQDMAQKMRVILDISGQMKSLNPYKVRKSRAKPNPEYSPAVMTTESKNKSPKRDSIMQKKVKFGAPIVESNIQKSEGGSRTRETMFKSIINSYYRKKPDYLKMMNKLNSDTSTIKTYENNLFNDSNTANSHHNYDYQGETFGGFDISHSKVASQIIGEIDKRMKYQRQFYKNRLKKIQDDFKGSHQFIKLNLKKFIQEELEKFKKKKMDEAQKTLDLKKEEVLRKIIHDVKFNNTFGEKIEKTVKEEYKQIIKTEVAKDLMDKLEKKEVNRISSMNEKITLNLAMKYEVLGRQIKEVDLGLRKQQRDLHDNFKTLTSENVKLDSRIIDLAKAQPKLVKKLVNPIITEVIKKENAKLEDKTRSYIESNNGKTQQIISEFMENARTKNNILHDSVKEMAINAEEKYAYFQLENKNLAESMNELRNWGRNYEELKAAIERVIKENTVPKNFEFLEEEQGLSSDENDIGLEVVEDQMILEKDQRNFFSNGLSTLVEYASPDEVLMTQFLKGYVFKSKFGTVSIVNKGKNTNHNHQSRRLQRPMLTRRPLHRVQLF